MKLAHSSERPASKYGCGEEPGVIDTSDATVSFATRRAALATQPKLARTGKTRTRLAAVRPPQQWPSVWTERDLEFALFVGRPMRCKICLLANLRALDISLRTKSALTRFRKGSSRLMLRGVASYGVGWILILEDGH